MSNGTPALSGPGSIGEARRSRVHWGRLAGLLTLVFSAGASAEAEAPESLFAGRVVPILESRCVVCHNSDRLSGGLDLTTQQAAMKGGDSGPAIVPAKVEESWLLDMVAGEEPAMPKNSKPLTAEQVADLRQWIRDGAKWPASVTVPAQFWSFRPVVRPRIPEVRDRPWVRNPIDAFVLDRLEDEGLAPAPAADKITLIRRATLDLHGLPPTPQQIDELLADKSSEAFARLVDRLLESPRYGERWGRHWR